MAWYYYAGGAAALAGLAFIARRKPDQSESTPAPGLTSPGTPLFMAGGGGGTMQAGTADLPLGGEGWLTPKTPLTENPDYAIAKLNADVNLAAIKASEKLQQAAIDKAALLDQPSIPTGETSGGKKGILSGNSLVAAEAGIRDVLGKVGKGGIGMEEAGRKIYEGALKYGYTKHDVAASYSAATGQKVSAAQIDSWLKQRGLSL